MESVTRNTLLLLLLLISACRPANVIAAPVPSQQQASNQPSAHDVSIQEEETLPATLERCWRAAEIGSNRNADFQQDVGLFRGEVRLKWCRTTLEARGPVERRGKRNHLVRIDSLVVRLWTDRTTAELRERRGEPAKLIVNGQTVDAAWWQSGSRERVLSLSRIPLR
jgi:hypothetical protein